MGKKVFALSFQVVKSIFGNPWHAALGRKEVAAWDAVSPWLKYLLVTGKMLKWDRESKFPSTAEITEGLIISILDAVK